LYFHIEWEYKTISTDVSRTTKGDIMHTAKLHNIFFLLGICSIFFTGCEGPITINRFPTPQPTPVALLPLKIISQSYPATIPLQQSFTLDTFQVQYPHGIIDKPQALIWLMTSPTTGFAIVQIDFSGDNLAMVSFTTNQQQWIYSVFQQVRLNTTSTSRPLSMPFGLPNDDYVSSEAPIAIFQSIPYTMQIWVSERRTFAYGYLGGIADKPSGTVHDIQISGHTARETLSQGWDIITIPSTNATTVLAGTTTSATSNEMMNAASKALAQNGKP
jgi:hypothetical protein